MKLVWIVAVAVAIVSSPVYGKRLRDMAPTSVQQLELRWTAWDQLRSDTDPAMHMMRGAVRQVPFRLDLTPYQGKLARIALVIPMSSGLYAPNALTVYWRGDGRIPDGQLSAGEKRTVFAGRISEPVLDTTLDFDLVVDSRLFNGRLRFEPYFEITVDSQ